MFFERFMWLAVLPAILLKVSSTQIVEFKCEADWPSNSLEKCEFEGEEFRPKPIVSRVARTALPDLTTVTFFENDGDLEEEVPKEKRTTPIPDSEIEPEYPKDDVSYPKRDPTEEPAWPNKWTKKPCCQLTCACYKFLTAPETGTPKKKSKAWKQQLCCYQKMLEDPNCANPPFYERFDPIEPPWCLR